MASDEILRARWSCDAQIVELIGRQLAGISLPRVCVELPRALAEQAVAAWRRDDLADDVDSPESAAQRSDRDHAATLALIGAAIDEDGVWAEDAVLVELDVYLVAKVIDAD